jgi:hypothetical protein
MQSLVLTPLLGWCALAVVVLWLVCLVVQYCRGVLELLAHRRAVSTWRTAYDKEQQEGIATINAIHNWSDEVYP